MIDSTGAGWPVLAALDEAFALSDGIICMKPFPKDRLYIYKFLVVNGYLNISSLSAIVLSRYLRSITGKPESSHRRLVMRGIST
jgi:hypothetical protein